MLHQLGQEANNKSGMAWSKAVTVNLHPILESQQQRDFQYHLCEDIMVHVNILQVQLFIQKFVKVFFDVVKLHLVDCFTYGLAPRIYNFFHAQF